MGKKNVADSEKIEIVATENNLSLEKTIQKGERVN